MNLPIRKAAIVLHGGDQEGLDRTIKMLYPYFNIIVVGADGDMPTVPDDPKIYVGVFAGEDATKGFGWKRSFMDSLVKEHEIHVHVDTDEVWDSQVLTDLAAKVTKDVPTWRIARCNMPHGNAYPDWQVRAFWYDKERPFEWKGDLHELLHDGDKPADQGKNIGTLDGVIVHLPRKKELNRPWWNE